MVIIKIRTHTKIKCSHTEFIIMKKYKLCRFQDLNTPRTCQLCTKSYRWGNSNATYSTLYCSAECEREYEPKFLPKGVY